LRFPLAQIETDTKRGCTCSAIFSRNVHPAVLFRGSVNEHSARYHSGRKRVSCRHYGVSGTWFPLLALRFHIQDKIHSFHQPRARFATVSIHENSL